MILILGVGSSRLFRLIFGGWAQTGKMLFHPSTVTAPSASFACLTSTLGSISCIPFVLLHAHLQQLFLVLLLVIHSLNVSSSGGLNCSELLSVLKDWLTSRTVSLVNLLDHYMLIMGYWWCPWNCLWGQLDHLGTAKAQQLVSIQHTPWASCTMWSCKWCLLDLLQEDMRSLAEFPFVLQVLHCANAENCNTFVYSLVVLSYYNIKRPFKILILCVCTYHIQECVHRWWSEVNGYPTLIFETGSLTGLEIHGFY